LLVGYQENITKRKQRRRRLKMARAAVKRVAQAEIRAAKSFLERRGLDSDDVSPRKFAMAAKELDKGFADTLKILARELSGGQV
jgi:hypothetical protein